MVIDTSAIVAILQNEPEQDTFIEAIESADIRLVSAASFLEASIVIFTRYGMDGILDLDLFMAKAGIEISSVDSDQANIARRAFRDFGRGRHPAELNFGDCFSYALARSLDLPLLFKGSDFSKTDIRQH
jgi:ribonuclease VapC